MSPAREVIRRVLIWGLVAVFFATTMTVAVLGQWTALLGFSAFPVVGAIILTSRPRNGVGWYLLGVAIVCIVIMWDLDPSLTRAAPPWAESAAYAIAGGFWVGLLAIGVLYPTGRLETRLGRITFWTLSAVAVASVGVTLIDPDPLPTGRPNPFAVTGIEPVLAAWGAALPVVILAIVAAVVVDVVRRWRHAAVVERLQYRWFVFGLLGVLAITFLSGLVFVVAPDSAYATVLITVATLALNIIPISIGIAVTRHGLYEIGRVVSRTVSYAIVTLLIVGMYAVVVVSVTRLLPGLPSVGVALATLLAAALFLPVLRWVQRRVDRRFDRERYDAAQVVDAFGEHLRTDVDPDSTAGELVEAVEQTLQPVAVGLWIARDTR